MSTSHCSKIVKPHGHWWTAGEESHAREHFAGQRPGASECVGATARGAHDGEALNVLARCESGDIGRPVENSLSRLGGRAAEARSVESQKADLALASHVVHD
ncbi:hypothetical protein HYQ46_003931 [Verticillium longisporum]|nr:hypothetical protein HYQ46_003931 [Verticillium longisporum]